MKTKTVKIALEGLGSFLFRNGKRLFSYDLPL